MAISLRKNITIPVDENELITNYSKKVGKSFSEVLRIAAIEYIRKEEAKDLATFLNSHCDFVDDEEQKKLESLILESDKDDMGEELSINDILYSKI